MSDKNTIELDKATLNNLEELAKEAGMSSDDYLRQLLFDRAALHLQRQKADPSLFLPQMVECHQSRCKQGEGISRDEFVGERNDNSVVAHP